MVSRRDVYLVDDGRSLLRADVRKSGLSAKRDYVIGTDQSWTNPKDILRRVIGWENFIDRKSYSDLPTVPYVEFEGRDSVAVYARNQDENAFSKGMLGPNFTLEKALQRHIPVVNGVRPSMVKKNKDQVVRTAMLLYRSDQVVEGNYIIADEQKCGILSEEFLSYASLLGVSPVIKNEGIGWYTSKQQEAMQTILSDMADKAEVELFFEDADLFKSNFSFL